MTLESRVAKRTRPPVAFICHASEDKQDFVLPFAGALRARGVHSWVDKWEIRLGDSLISKVFDDGIENADIFIPVLSRQSIDKRWVREEINAGLLKRIEGEVLVIPVLLQGVPTSNVPLALRHLLWVSGPAAQYDAIASAIAGRIFGTDLLDAPEIGPFPLQIEWEPDVGDGECGASVVRGGFIPWPQLKDELVGGVFPRVDNLPDGALPVVRAFKGRPQWVIEIEHPSLGKVGDIWVGQDPARDYAFTGLVNVRVTAPHKGRLQRFQRFSDGFYRIVEGPAHS